MYYRPQGQRVCVTSGVYDFIKRSSIIHCTAHGSKTIAGVASTLAHSESLTAHARSAEYVVTRDELIQVLIPERVRQVSAYQIPDATGMVKLDAMENPYRWPQSLHDELATRLADCALNRYPDPHADLIRAPLAQWMKSQIADLLFGNGSDEIIGLLISTSLVQVAASCALILVL